MKNQTNTNFIIRSSLALALALVIWSPSQARSAEPTAGMMMDGKMMADMKAQDAQLTEQIAQMNSAPEDQKLDLMAAVVTKMAAQRTAMNMRMGKMRGEMMGTMMPSMQMDTNSMSQEPMMNGKMSERFQAMQEQRQKMMADMKTQDAQLTGQIAQMNSAPADQKLDLMAAIVTRMAEQRSDMNARMGKMQGEMMQTMPMGHDSMSQDSMMKDMADKSGDAPAEQK